MVSVPSRGILFPNADKELDEKIAKGFRPLSGYLISKCYIGKADGILYAFPSPLGVSYFQIHNEYN